MEEYKNGVISDGNDNMGNKTNKLDDNLAVSGGGARWSDGETALLLKCVRDHYTSNYEGYFWESIAEYVNSKYKNGRTAQACFAKFQSKGGDNAIDIDDSSY